MARKKHTSTLNISKANRLYALGKPVEAWLSVPGKVHTFWKDAKGLYLGANDATIQSILMKSAKDMVGMHDSDLVRGLAEHNKLKGCPEHKKQHSAWINDDNLVFNSGRTLLFYNYVIGFSKCISFLSQKTPVYDIDNKIVGTFGLCFYLSERYLSSFRDSLELSEYVANFESHARGQSHNNIPNRIIIRGVALSARETACGFYLAKGFSTKQIGIKLALSPRTVEGYLNNIKEKTLCASNSELVGLLFNCGIF